MTKTIFWDRFWGLVCLFGWLVLVFRNRMSLCSIGPETHYEDQADFILTVGFVSDTISIYVVLSVLKLTM